jgi:hypothetical protein
VAAGFIPFAMTAMRAGIGFDQKEWKKKKNTHQTANGIKIGMLAIVECLIINDRLLAMMTNKRSFIITTILLQK